MFVFLEIDQLLKKTKVLYDQVCLTLVLILLMLIKWLVQCFIMLIKWLVHHVCLTLMLIFLMVIKLLYLLQTLLNVNYKTTGTKNEKNGIFQVRSLFRPSPTLQSVHCVREPPLLKIQDYTTVHGVLCDTPDALWWNWKTMKKFFLNHWVPSLKSSNFPRIIKRGMCQQYRRIPRYPVIRWLRTAHLCLFVRMQRLLTLLPVILLVINISSSDSEDEKLIQVHVIKDRFVENIRRIINFIVNSKYIQYNSKL